MDNDVMAEVMREIVQRGADVYLYADIDTISIIKCYEALSDAIAYLYEQKGKRVYGYMYDAPLSVRLHIKSGGGDLFSGFALHDHIKALALPVDIFLEGLAASAATIITLAGRRVYALPSTMIMIHQLWGATHGTYSQLKDSRKLDDMLHSRMLDLYARKLGIGRDEIDNLLKHDYWMDVAEAVKIGLVDEVIGDE